MEETLFGVNTFRWRSKSSKCNQTQWKQAWACTHTHTHSLFTSLLVSPSSTWYLLDCCRLIWIVWPDVRWNVASVFLLSCGFMSLYQYMLSWQDMTQLFLWYNLRSTNQFNTQTDSQTCRFGSSEDKLWQKYLKYWHTVPIENQFCHLQTGFKQQLGLKRMNVLFPPVEKSNRCWWHSCLLNQNAKRRGMLFCLFFFFFFKYNVCFDYTIPQSVRTKSDLHNRQARESWNVSQNHFSPLRLGKKLK